MKGRCVVVNSVVFSGVTRRRSQGGGLCYYAYRYIGSNAETRESWLVKIRISRHKLRSVVAMVEIVVVPEGEIVYATVKKDQVV